MLVQIAEPMTVATDLALAALGATLAWRLGAAARRPGLAARRWWAVALAATAVAALAGGVWHGVQAQLPGIIGAGLWKLTLLAAGATSFALAAAAAFAGLEPRWRRAALIGAAVKSAAYLAWIAASDDFLAVVIDSGLALLFLAAVHGARWQRAGSPSIVAGVAVALLGGAIQAARLAPHPMFNHNDLYHVIEMAALLLFFRGARRLEDWR